MKKLKLFFACLLMAVLSIGQMWATVSGSIASSIAAGDQVVLVNTGEANELTGVSNNLGTQASYSNGTPAGTCVLTVEAGKSGTGTFSLKMSNDSYLAYTQTGSGNNKLYTISSPSTDDQKKQVSWTVSINGTTKVATITNVYNTARKLQFNSDRFCCYTSTQTAVKFFKVNTSSPTLSLTPTSVSVGATSVANQSVTLTPANFAGSITSVTTGLYIDAECENEIGTGDIWVTDITVNGAKTAVTFNVADNDGELRQCWLKITASDGTSNASAILPITQAKYTAPTGTFKPYSGDIAEGDYLIVADGAGMNTTVSSSRLQYTALTLTGANYVNPDVSVVWHIAASATEGYWTIYNDADGNYAAATGSNNQAQMLASGTDDKSLWTITHSNADYTITNKSNSRYLKKNGTYGYGCYADGTVSLYKLDDGTPNPPTFSPAGGSFLEAQSVTLSAETGTTIHYTTDGTTPTALSATYSTAIPVSTTTTIKAIAVKDDKSSSVASATYTITTPLSVAAAIDLIPNANDQVNDQYVEGFVCTAGTSVSSGKMTYYISADGKETNRLQIYKGKNLDNTAFTAADNLAVGDKVVVFGQLKNFSGTHEMNDGNYIKRYTAKGDLQSVVVSGTPTKTAYSVDEAFDPAGLVVTATYENGYAVAVTPTSWSATPATVSAEGDISVIATYGGQTSPAYLVHVTVLAATLDHISLSYDAVEVYQGLELPKPTVTAHWSDATTSDVTALADFAGYDASTTGDQTITVSYEFGTSGPKEATYTVTVNPIFNVELAASVARNLIINSVGNTESTEDMIVRGKVSYINNASSNTQTYWISDDGTRTNEVEIYKGKYLSNANFTSTNQLRVGDEVVVIGKVIYFNNSTPEFANGKSQVQSLARTPGFAITDIDELEVGSADLAVSALTITVEGEGAVTFASSSNTGVVNIVDGKLRAVAAGTATITANLAQNGIYKAASTTFSVTVIAATTKYAITFDGNDADGGTAPTAIANQAEGAEVTLPANTWTKTNKIFDGWKVINNSTSAEITVTAGKFTMPASAVTIQAQWADPSVWALTYTSNVDITYVTYGSNDAVSIDDTEYDAAKAGTSSYTGKVKVTVPVGAHTLHFHAITWNNAADIVVTASGVTNMSQSTFTLKKDAGATGSSLYTIAGTPYMQYYSFTFDAVESETEILFEKTSGSEKRFIFYGVNQEGGVVPVLDHIAITGTMTNTTGWKTGDDITPEGLTVTAYYTLNDAPHHNTDVTDDVVWSHAALVEDQTEVTLTATYTDEVEKTANVNVTIDAVETGDPTIITNPATQMTFTAIDKGAELPAAKTISVTLKNIATATATLGGSNPEVFALSKTTGIVDGDVINVTIPSTDIDAASYSATVTIKDDASTTQKVINLYITINEPVATETPVGTDTKWVPATTISDGMQVLITGMKNDETYAMGAQNTNNRAAVKGSVDGEGIFTPGANTMAFTLVAQEDGTYALRTSLDQYLYASTSNKNHLRTQDEVDDNAKWTLSVTSAVAESSSNRNVMQFNTNDLIFSCYGSASQSPIKLYVQAYTVTFNSNEGSAVAPVNVAHGQTVAQPANPTREGYTFNYWTLNEVEYDFDTPVTDNITLVANWTEDTPTPVYTEVRSGLEPGRYYTVCLPREVVAVKGATFWTLKNKNMEGSQAYLEEETNNLPFAAGKPFIIQATANKLEVAYEGDATEVAGTNGALHGTLVYMNAAALAAAGSDIYMLFSNELRPVGDDNHLDANRAYVKLSELDAVAEAPQSAPGRRVVAMPMEKDVTTDINALNAAEAPVKMIIDGNLFILRGEKLYDATGRLVK